MCRWAFFIVGILHVMLILFVDNLVLFLPLGAGMLFAYNSLCIASERLIVAPKHFEVKMTLLFFWGHTCVNARHQLVVVHARGSDAHLSLPFVFVALVSMPGLAFQGVQGLLDAINLHDVDDIHVVVGYPVHLFVHDRELIVFFLRVVSAFPAR